MSGTNPQGRLFSQHAEFLSLTYRRYREMSRRTRERYPSAQLDFSLDAFRRWMTEQLGGEQGATRCFYCATPIDAGNCEIDHKMPLEQACETSLDNLCLACRSCNQQKGAMTAGAFFHLLTLVNDTTRFTDIDRVSVLGRLQIAIRLAIKNQKFSRKPKVRVVPHQRGV